MKGLVAGIALLVAWAWAGVAVRAECIALSVPNAKRTAVLVFEGTVTKVETLHHPESAATLNVHRVWKGDVPTEITVYYLSDPLDGPWLKEGERRIIFAQHQTPGMRKARGIAADSPMRDVWVPPCSGVWRPDDDLIKQLGRAREPKDTSRTETTIR